MVPAQAAGGALWRQTFTLSGALAQPCPSPTSMGELRRRSPTEGPGAGGQGPQGSSRRVLACGPGVHRAHRRPGEPPLPGPSCPFSFHSFTFGGFDTWRTPPGAVAGLPRPQGKILRAQRPFLSTVSSPRPGGGPHPLSTRLPQERGGLRPPKRTGQTSAPCPCHGCSPGWKGKGSSWPRWVRGPALEVAFDLGP